MRAIALSLCCLTLIAACSTSGEPNDRVGSSEEKTFLQVKRGNEVVTAPFVLRAVAM
jgi:hypothetical protein